LTKLFLKLTLFHSNYPPPDITIVTIITILTIIILFKTYLLPSNFTTNNFKYKHFSIFFLTFLFVFILTFDLTEISHRLIFLTYFFIPFIFPILVFKNKKLLNSFYSVFFIAFMSCYFIYKFDNSIYTYAPLEYVFSFLPLHLLT
jgi:hypothetical protein